jgi:AraC-like DNA-binding protein
MPTSQPLPSCDDATAAWPQTMRCAPVAARDWEQVLGRVMQPGELTLCASAGQGSASTARLSGGGMVADLTLPALTVMHRPEHLPHARRREALIHIVLEGAGHLQQAGRAVPFRAGDITFRDAHWPSRADFDGRPARLIALRLPLSRWPGCFPLGLNGPGIAPRDHALTQAVHGFWGRMQTGLPALTPAATAALEQAFVWTLGAACCQFHTAPAAPAAPSLRARRQQAHDYIDAHLFDPSLSPAACARALGVSERYLHRALGQHGERFSQLVAAKRLDASAQRLRDPRFAHLHISGIAWRCGFQDAAHFSRVFARRFGVAPRAWRGQHPGGL